MAVPSKSGPTMQNGIRLAFACCFTLTATSASLAADDAAFGLTKLHRIHLKIEAKDYAAMEPAGGGFPFGPGGPGGPGPAPPGPGRPSGAGRPALGAPDASGIPAAGGFGFDFPEVHAALQIGEASFPDVGLRYKGNANYMMAARAAKRPLKI